MRPLSKATTAFVESAVNQVMSKRLVQKQHMWWSGKGTHNLLQVRTWLLNGVWRSIIARWHPTLGGAETNGPPATKVA
ncbi:MAG: hypothetical protein HP496_12930 [Nitrospira sp.]|nr:hypothetical protein [Nitrospira sp.]